MNARFVGAVALLLSLSIVGSVSCADGGSAGTSSQRRFVSLGTAPAGGAFFVVGSALGEVLNQFKGENSWEVNAESTSGTLENIRRLQSGELNFAMANAAITFFSTRSGQDLDSDTPIRSVMTLAPNVALFLTRQSSAIRRIADLKGQRVVVGPSGAGFEYFLQPILRAHGLSYDDFTPLYATQASAVDLLADGSAAAIFVGGAVPTSSITQAAASQEIFFIPFDDQAQEDLLSRYRVFRPATIPAGTYRGQSEDFKGLDVGSMHLITSADEDEELVYQVTKTLWENRERVVEKHAAGRAINLRNVARDTGVPLHPGAARFYREIGATE